MHTQTDFIVIGAGYAGLTATHELLIAGKTVRLLEARPRVGGRVFTQTYDDGTYLDLGGQWVGPSQDRIYALAREFGVATFKTYDEGKSTLLHQNRMKRYQGLIPPLPIFALLSLDAAIKKMNKLAKKIVLDAPWQSPRAAHWDSLTLQSWMDQQMWSGAARQMFKLAVEVIFAAPPSEISMLHALFYTQSGRDLDTLMNIKNGAQEERFVGGAQQVANRLAESFPAGTLELGRVVRRIVQNNEGVEVSGDGGWTYTARRVVVALPPTLAGQLLYEPHLPANRTQLMQRMPMGTVWKCYAVYDRPFWRAEGLNGLCASTEDLVSVTFDNSPVDGSKGILMGFVVANQAKIFAEMNESERRTTVLQTFAKMAGPQALQPQFYVDQSWANEIFSGGCYAGFMPPGVWTSLGTYLRQPCGLIHWAGTETSDVWNGYIDGAVRSGERAATELLSKE
jgi:monoamine oxidase